MINFSSEGREAIKLLQAHLRPLSDQADALVSRLRDQDYDAAMDELAAIRQGLLEQVGSVAPAEHANIVSGLAVAFVETVRERLEAR